MRGVRALDIGIFVKEIGMLLTEINKGGGTSEYRMFIYCLQVFCMLFTCKDTVAAPEFG